MAKILVVDDQRNMRATTAMLLRAEGYEVAEAGGGEEAMALVRELRGAARSGEDPPQRNRNRDRDGERRVGPALRRRGQHGPHVLAVQVLHRDEVLAGGLADVVDLHDVLVVQRGRDAGLVEEHPDEARIARGSQVFDALYVAWRRRKS